MKKLAVATAAALLMAGTSGVAFAQSIDPSTDIVANNNLGEDAYITFDFDGEDSFNSNAVSNVDLDDDAFFNSFGNSVNNSDGNNLMLNTVFDFDEIAANVLSLAANLETVNASINISGGDITINSADATATATATAEAAESTANAVANAVSGSTFTTTALGALNSSNVSIDASMVTNTGEFESTDLAFEGMEFDLDWDGIDEEYADFEVDAYGEESWGDEETVVASFDGNISAAYSYVNNISANLIAVNMAGVDASVNILANYEPASVFHDATRGYVDLTNINITTTAIGAITSGSLRLGALAE